MVGPAPLRCTFYDKKSLRMSTFVMDTSQRIVGKSVTDTKCWVGRQEDEDAVQKLFQRKVQ